MSAFVSTFLRAGLTRKIKPIEKKKSEECKIKSKTRQNDEDQSPFHHAKYVPINQSSKQLNNQIINQSINRPFIQSINQSVDCSIDWTKGALASPALMNIKNEILIGTFSTMKKVMIPPSTHKPIKVCARLLFTSSCSSPTAFGADWLCVWWWDCGMACGITVEKRVSQQSSRRKTEENPQKRLIGLVVSADRDEEENNKGRQTGQQRGEQRVGPGNVGSRYHRSSCHCRLERGLFQI